MCNARLFAIPDAVLPDLDERLKRTRWPDQLPPEQVIGVHLTGIIGAAGAAPPFTAAEQKFIDAGAAIEPEIVARDMQTFFGALPR